MAAKKTDDRLLRNGPLAQGNGDGQQLQLHAKFQDPMDKALRYQRATARDFYRPLNLLYKLRRERKPNSRDCPCSPLCKFCGWEKAAHRCSIRNGAASQVGYCARTIGCKEVDG